MLCTSKETTRLIRDEEKGEAVEMGEEGYIYHYHNDSCIKMGSDESHFNVSLIVRDKVTRVSTNHNLSEERIRAEVPLITSLTPYR